MLNVLDGVINQNRFDVDVTDGVIASGIEGLWVAPQTNGKYDFEENAKVAFCIWTESSKDGEVGFTEDANYLKKVAVLGGGGWRGETDQFEGTPTAGTELEVSATGTLEAGSTYPVAVCLKAKYNKVWNGRTIEVIEFVTK